MEYFLNAIHYCLWLKQIKSQRRSKRQADIVSEFIANHLLSECARERFFKRKEKNEIAVRQLMDDKSNGFNIGWANHWFGYLYSSYPALLTSLSAALIIRFSNDINSNLIFTLLVISTITPIGLAYILVYNSIYKKDKYLRYFKKFKRENETWLKKWEKRTNLFIGGAIMMDIIGLASMFAILILT